MRVPVETFVMPFNFKRQKTDYDVKKLVAGYKSICEGFGYSIVTDVKIYADYDIDHDERRVLIEARVIDIPNVNVVLQKPTNYIELTDSE